jgi:outer membrane biogenesis lipoprotein LolB
VVSLEGYASLRVVREGTSARSRFSFLFVLPDQGIIVVTDPLNRTAARLFLGREEAYLVLPGKRVYWKAVREEVMSKLLGFALTPEEFSAILTGRAEALGGWELETDGQGRLARGRRQGLAFSVRQFFPESRLPRIIALDYGGDQGSLRILRVRFNEPIEKDALRLSFLEDARYMAVTWTEMEKWLRHED